MKTTHTLGVVALLCVSLATPYPAAADAVSQCGEAQAKISAKLVKAILLEATRACGSGSAQNPGPLDVGKLQAALDKASAAIQTAVDKFGAPNCYPTPVTTDIGNAIAVADNFARKLCRVP